MVLAAACTGSDDSGAPSGPADGQDRVLQPVAVPEPEIVEETRTLIGEEGGVARVGGASLTVPAGSLAPGTVVLAQQLVDPTDVARGPSIAAAPGPVRFLADGDVLGPLTVSIPVMDGVDEARILSAEEGSILWFDETTEVLDGFAVAEVDHLTSFVAVSPTISNLSYTIFRLIGARTDVPECPQGPPAWVLDIISPARESLANGDLPNAPLLPCGDRVREGDADLLALRVAANRGYTIVVRGPDVDVERRALRGGGLGNARGDLENALLTGIADGLGVALRRAGADPGARLAAIPALRTSEFLIEDPLDGGPGFRMLSVETVPPLDPEAFAFSILVDMFSVALAQIGSTGLEDLATCVDAIVSVEGAEGVDEALGIFDACNRSAPEEGVRARLDLQRWFQRAKTPIQIGLLTVERAADMFNPDQINIAVENARTGAGQSAVPDAPADTVDEAGDEVDADEEAGPDTGPTPTPTPAPAPAPAPQPAPAPAAQPLCPLDFTAPPGQAGWDSSAYPMEPPIPAPPTGTLICVRDTTEDVLRGRKWRYALEPGTDGLALCLEYRAILDAAYPHVQGFGASGCETQAGYVYVNIGYERLPAKTGVMTSFTIYDRPDPCPDGRNGCPIFTITLTGAYG